MKWIMALALGALVAFVLPTAVDLRSGLWMDSWTGWGTIRPQSRSPGLLFSIPIFLGAAIAFRMFFNWHN